jgi:hypothetical protein
MFKKSYQVYRAIKDRYCRRKFKENGKLNTAGQITYLKP